MIKFKALIHKETGTVIKYLYWKQHIEAKLDKMVFTAKNNKTLEIYDYPTKEMLFSDDFEIIYESEFTEEELWLVHCRCGEDENLQDKVRDILKNRDELRYKYGIEMKN